MPSFFHWNFGPKMLHTNFGLWYRVENFNNLHLLLLLGYPIGCLLWMYDHAHINLMYIYLIKSNSEREKKTHTHPSSSKQQLYNIYTSPLLSETQTIFEKHWLNQTLNCAPTVVRPLEMKTTEKIGEKIIYRQTSRNMR